MSTYSYSCNPAIGILWFGAALGAAALFAVSAKDGYDPRPLEPRSLATVVNATNSDGSMTVRLMDSSDPRREIEELRKKIRALEVEMAAFKRQNRSSDPALRSSDP